MRFLVFREEMPAPVMSEGERLQVCRMWKIIPTVVLLPDVPATAMVFRVRVMAFNKSERFTRGMPRALAFWISGLEDSMAVEAMMSWVFSVMPEASWEKHWMFIASNWVRLTLVLPSLNSRSEPETCLLMPERYCANALMPVPATPMKK